MEAVVTTGAVGRAKLQSNSHLEQTNSQVFTGQMSFLSPNQQCQTLSLSLSHHFNGHSPGEPGLSGVYLSQDDGGGGDSWSYKSRKSSSPTNQHRVFTDRMPFLSPNLQCQSTEGKNYVECRPMCLSTDILTGWYKL